LLLSRKETAALLKRTPSAVRVYEQRGLLARFAGGYRRRLTANVKRDWGLEVPSSNLGAPTEQSVADCLPCD
jgi:hypothetical protein